MRGAAAALALLGALPAASAPPPPPPPDEKPFPVPDRSMILREEKTVYLVEGRVKIPRGVEVSIQKDVHIRAREGAAVIEVEGNLEVHGVGAREVVFEGVTVEPASSFQKIQLDTCIFRGGGLATTEGKPAAGDLMVQHCRFTGGARVDLSFASGTVQLLDGTHDGTTRLRGVDGEGRPNRVKATLRGFGPEGLHAENLADLTVRICGIGKGPVVLKDNRVLIFDGCKVEAPEISFLQSEAGRFVGTKVMKCDLYSGKIVFRAPKKEKVADTVTMDKCWFQGERRPDALAAKVVDGADEPDNNVRVRFSNPLERPLELAGSVNR